MLSIFPIMISFFFFLLQEIVVEEHQPQSVSERIRNLNSKDRSPSPGGRDLARPPPRPAKQEPEETRAAPPLPPKDDSTRGYKIDRSKQNSMGY